MDRTIRTGVGIGLISLTLWTGLRAAQEDAPSANAPAADAAPAEAAPSPPADAPTLATVVEKLSADNRRKFGELLAADWKKRPEWADMLISLLKNEPMGPGAGWFKFSERRYDWKWLAARFDADGDGAIAAEELPESALFAELLLPRMDRDNDGRLRESDFDHFSRQQQTPPQYMSQFLASFFDTDSNGRITRDELEAFLKRSDVDQTGFITGEDLYRDFSALFSSRDGGGSDMPRPERMLPMFFRGEFGVLEAGPALGEVAPEFTLPTHDGSRVVTLSASRGRPVILIFGSFT